MDSSIKRIGDVTIERVSSETNPNNEKMNFDTDSESETQLSDDDLHLETSILDLGDKNAPQGHSNVPQGHSSSSSVSSISLQSVKRKNEYEPSAISKKTKSDQEISIDSVAIGEAGGLNLDSVAISRAGGLNLDNVAISRAGNSNFDILPRNLENIAIQRAAGLNLDGVAISRAGNSNFDNVGMQRNLDNIAIQRAAGLNLDGVAISRAGNSNFDISRNLENAAIQRAAGLNLDGVAISRAPNSNFENVIPRIDNVPRPGGINIIENVEISRAGALNLENLIPRNRNINIIENVEIQRAGGLNLDGVAISRAGNSNFDGIGISRAGLNLDSVALQRAGGLNRDSVAIPRAGSLNSFEESADKSGDNRTHLSDNEDSEYDSEEDTDTEDISSKIDVPEISDVPKESIESENSDFIEKLATEIGESSQKSEEDKIEDYDYDITEKLKEMGEISVETVKKGDKPRKTENSEETENEISVTPATKKDSGSDSEDKLSSEKKIGNMRRNIREVMDETQLDEATLAAQRQEMERLRRVQEQQRIIREVQRQIALNRQNNKTQHRVISLLQGNSSLIKTIPGASSSKDALPSASGGPTSSMGPHMSSQGGTGPSQGTVAGKIGGTVLVKLPNGETKPMTRITKSGAPFEVVRLQKGALQGKMQRNLIPIKKNAGGNLTPSVSIAPVAKIKIEPKIETDSESDFSDSEKKVRKVAGKPKDVVTISSSSDDDCIVLSEDEPEEPEPEEDPCNSGMHTNDSYNVPDEQGRVLINVGHPENEAPVYLAPQISRVIKPHQIGGVRFLFDNVIESVDRFSTSTGFGCILAHSMGLGKTLQIVCFSDIFLRHTEAKTILCIMPINTLQNWMAEYNMWLPKDPTSSPLLNNGEIRPRNFNLYVLNDSHKTLIARAKVIQEWKKDGGVLLIGYELYRLLSLRRNSKVKKKKKSAGNAPDRPDTPEDDEKNKNMFEEIHEALVKPGPDLVICDEGHRIKNSHASISQALKQIRSKRRIVLTGYPLQNNLLEYWCMVDFVRPNYLGTKTEFSNMFERPIQNGQCIDSTPQDIRLMRYRAHVLHSLLEGFVQRRSHAVLQTSLPQKEEYVLLVRMTEFQRKLYDTFMNEVVRTKTVPNPLKAFAVCCKIWNHPDVLYYFLKKQTAGEAVDLDLEEVAGTVPGSQTPTQTTPKKGSSRSKGRKEKKTPASKNSAKPAASVTPNTNTTTTVSNTTPSATNPQNVPPNVNTFPAVPQNVPTPQNNPNMPPPANINPQNPVQGPQNPQNYPQVGQTYQGAPYPYPQQNYPQYPQNGEFYNQNTNYPNNFNQNYYPNQEYSGFYPENKPENYNMGYQHNEGNYWPQNNQQNNQYYQQNQPENNYYNNMNQQYNNQDYYRQPQGQYNQNYQQNNLYQNNPNQYPQNQGQWGPQNPQNPQNSQNDFNKPQEAKQEFGPNSEFGDPKNEKLENMDVKPNITKLESDMKDLKTDDKMKTELDDEKKSEILDKLDENMDKEMEVDIKAAELAAQALVKKEDPGIPYDWAHELMKGYVQGCIENSAKMQIFFCILEESMALGDRILLFSQSLFTLNLIEEFLQRSDVPGMKEKWAKNKHYYRLDGSTSALEREKLINEYNSNPNIHLFLVSTRAGSLGINLVGANRVIVFDASWNPCHDTQAVCRVYRYGQKKPCFVYRIVMDNCLEKKIYDRQINKQGMADRVVDECNPDAHLSMKDVTNLCWDDEKESEVKDFSTTKDKYIDVVMQKVLDAYSSRLSKEPFQHESLLIDRKEKKLSQAEKRLAKRSYELEKQANINSRPSYSYYPSGSGQGLQIRAIRGADGSLQNKPVASVRPMQSENMVRDLGQRGAGTTGRSRWIPAEVWQRQGMTAQEMTLPLDVVIPTNSPDRGSIVLKAGQKVLVLKSPKGIYMQLECGKIVAIKTAFKVRGGKAPDKGDESKDGGGPTTILKKLPQGANTSKNSGNVPLPLKNNSAITVIPKGGQQKLVRPFTQGVTKLNMRSIRQPVPNLVGRQVPMRLGGPRFTGKIQSIHRKVQLAKAKPYNLEKTTIDMSKVKTEPVEPEPEPEPQVVPSSDEEIHGEPSKKHPESPENMESLETETTEPFPENQFSEGEKSIENIDMERLSNQDFPESSGDRRPSTESYQSEKNSIDSYGNLDSFQNPEKFPPAPEAQFSGENSDFQLPQTQTHPEIYPVMDTRFPPNQNFPQNPPEFPENPPSFSENSPNFSENSSNFSETSQAQTNFHQNMERYPSSFDKFPVMDKKSPQDQELIEKPVPPLIETKKATFQVQNAPLPISSAIIHDSGNTSRSLKNYRHNFASQKATKTQKPATTSSALHQLEQTTCSIGENKQPFQESLDNITNSYGGVPEAKNEENVIDLDEKTEENDKTKSGLNKQQQSPKPDISLPTTTNPPLAVLSHPSASQGGVPPLAAINSAPGPTGPQQQQQQQLQPQQNPNQDFPPAVGASYGGYYGYGGPHNAPHVQPYPPPPQNWGVPPEMPANKDRKKVVAPGAPTQNVSTAPNVSPEIINTPSVSSVQPTPSIAPTAIAGPPTATQAPLTPSAGPQTPSNPPSGPQTPNNPPISSVPPLQPISTTVSTAPTTTPTHAGYAPPGGPTAGGFAPYGQPGMPPPPHGGYDMMYGQQNQYGGNYPGLPYPNQPNFQPYNQQYDQGYPPGTPGAPNMGPNMYSAFHRPDVHHQYPPTDPYQYSHVRNYPPQYGYPPPGAAPHGQYPGGPAPGYDYQYNAGGFPPPPPFVGPPYSGLPNNNAIP